MALSKVEKGRVGLLGRFHRNMPVRGRSHAFALSAWCARTVKSGGASRGVAAVAAVANDNQSRPWRGAASIVERAA
jgi:hypothetical protein